MWGWYIWEINCDFFGCIRWASKGNLDNISGGGQIVIGFQLWKHEPKKAEKSIKNVEKTKSIQYFGGKKGSNAYNTEIRIDNGFTLDF